jgi:ATP-dependent Clp protease adaptor protein ClpS|tara:strand:- start:9 stop:317 length:309 start_codon:yes stop_codon:yes gene_type:complete
MSTNTDVVIDEKIKVKAKEPSTYKVIFLNDDYTPMDFVVQLMIDVFKHSDQTAQQITIQIHEKGSGVVGEYYYEVAEQKSIEAMTICKQHGFPLQIKIEENK